MLNSLKNGFLSLLVSRACYGCDEDLSIQEKLICLHCLSQLQPTGFAANPLDNEMYYRLAGKVPFEGAMAMYHYDKKGLLQELIVRMKYKGAAPIGFRLGEEMGRELKASGYLDGIDALLPLPLHFWKQMKRGFNQAEKICLGISRASGIPMRTDILKRIRYTKPQARQIGDNRYKNVKGAFRRVHPAPGGVLLVDDVLTQGTTMEEAIRALAYGAGAPKLLKVATLALTRKM